MLELLYQLLRKVKTWFGGKAQDDAFKEAKGLLCSSKLLVHYNPCKHLVLSCEASADGVGCALQ